MTGPSSSRAQRADKIVEGRKQDSQIKRARLNAAIDEMLLEDKPITRAAIAQRARTSTYLLYNDEDLRVKAENAIAASATWTAPTQQVASAASNDALRTDLALARAEVADLRSEVQRLRTRLQATLGAEIDSVSRDELVARIAELELALLASNRESEQTGPELRRLQELNGRLEAEVQAQSDANRLLMKELNQLRRAQPG